MIVLGLTGSIATGKSTVGAMLKTMHIPVHEADHAVHTLLMPGSLAFPDIMAAFPRRTYPEIYDKKTGVINRKALGALVFDDDALREALEAILHPLVRVSQKAFLRQAESMGCDIACLDIPLLFETGAQKNVDYTIAASAPYSVQRARVLERPGMDEERFHKILQRQMPDREKCRRADYVIKTGLGRAQTIQALKAVLSDICGYMDDEEAEEDAQA